MQEKLQKYDDLDSNIKLLNSENINCEQKQITISQDLKQKVQDLQQQLTEQKKQSDLETDILKEQINKSNKILKDNEESISQLNQQMQQMNTIIKRQKEEKVLALEDRNYQVQKIQMIEEQNNKFEERIKQLNEQISEKDEEKNKLLNEVSLLKQQIIDYENIQINFDLQKVEFKDKINNLEQELRDNQKNSIIESLKADAEVYNIQIENLNSQIQNLNLSQNEKEKTISKLNTEINEQDKTFKSEKQFLNQLIEELQRKLNDINEKDKENIQDPKQNQVKQKGIDIIKQKESQIDQSQQKTIDELQQEQKICEQKSSVQQLELIISSQNQTINDLQKINDQQQLALKEMEKAINLEQKTIEDLQQTINSLSNSINDLNSVINDLQSSNKEYQTLVQQLNQQIEELNKQNNQLMELIQQQNKNQVDDNLKQNDFSEKQITDSQKDQIKQLIELNSKELIQKQTQELTDKLTELDQIILLQRQRIIQLENILSQREQEIKSYQKATQETIIQQEQYIKEILEKSDEIKQQLIQQINILQKQLEQEKSIGEQMLKGQLIQNQFYQEYDEFNQRKNGEKLKYETVEAKLKVENDKLHHKLENIKNRFFESTKIIQISSIFYDNSVIRQQTDNSQQLYPLNQIDQATISIHKLLSYEQRYFSDINPISFLKNDFEADYTNISMPIFVKPIQQSTYYAVLNENIDMSQFYFGLIKFDVVSTFFRIGFAPYDNISQQINFRQAIYADFCLNTAAASTERYRHLVKMNNSYPIFSIKQGYVFIRFNLDKNIFQFCDLNYQISELSQCNFKQKENNYKLFISMKETTGSFSFIEFKKQGQKDLNVMIKKLTDNKPEFEDIIQIFI